jgi:hypothetical protein
VENRLLKLVFKVASFAAFFITLILLAISPYRLGGSWSGGASKYLVCYMTFLLGIFWIIKLFFPHRRNSILLFFTAIFLLVIAGILQVLALIYFVLSCICLGLLITRKLNFDAGPKQFVASGVIGSAIYALIFNALVTLPVHYQFVYMAVFALPIIALLFSRYLMVSIIPVVCSGISKVSSELQLAGTKSFFIFTVTLAYIAAYILFPNINSDENAVHLSIWSQFSHKAFFSIDPATQVWSVAPNTFTVIHGVLSLLSGGDAKGALNVSLLILLLITIFKLLDYLDINCTEKLTLVTLFLTTPLVVFTLIGLQTDLFLALLLSAASMMLIDLLQNYRLTTAVALIFVGSLALSAKLPAVTIAGPVLLLVVYASVRHKNYSAWSVSHYIKICGCLVVAAALAFWPYIRAYIITGNPVFPLYNAVFQSDFFDFINFKDLRWNTGVSLSSYYGLFFESKAHLESGNNFVGGFQYFLLAPLAAIVMLVLRIKNVSALLVLALCYFLPLFFSLQYLRYFFAAMPLLSVLVGALYLLGRKDGNYRKWLSASFYVTAFLNFIFMPGVCSLFFISPFAFFSSEKQEQAIREYMPEHQLNSVINKLKPNATVLMDLDRSFGATLTGRPIYNSFYAQGYFNAIKKWTTQSDVHNALKLWDVDFVYWDQKQAYNSTYLVKNLMREELISYGKPVAQVGGIVAFTIADSELQYQEVFIGQDLDAFKNFKVVAGQLQLESDGIKMRAQDVLSKSFDLSRFTRFKYSVEFSCEKDTDYFVAHIDWGNGSPYYKLLQCHPGLVSYAEVGLIPAATHEAAVALSVRTESFIKVHRISIEAN